MFCECLLLRHKRYGDNSFTINLGERYEQVFKESSRENGLPALKLLTPYLYM